MNISVRNMFLEVDDHEAALAFYRDALGFEVRQDVAMEGARWLTVGPPTQPDLGIVLATVGVGRSDEDARTLRALLAKGSLGGLVLEGEHPIPGATVYLGGAALRAPRRTVTDRHGTFVFRGVGMGKYTMRAAHERQAQVVVERWRRQYNEERPHSALGYRTPADGPGRDRRGGGSMSVGPRLSFPVDQIAGHLNTYDPLTPL